MLNFDCFFSFCWEILGVWESNLKLFSNAKTRRENVFNLGIFKNKKE